MDTTSPDSKPEISNKIQRYIVFSVNFIAVCLHYLFTYIYFSPQVNDTTQLPNTVIERPENGMTKIVKNNGKNKKLKISREIKCPACKAVFPTKESMSLHTCNSILDRHISEEGKERQKIPTVSQNLKKVEFKI